MTEGTTAHDEATIRRDAAALFSLSSKSPVGTASLQRLSPSTLQAAASKAAARDPWEDLKFNTEKQLLDFAVCVCV